MPVPRKLRPLLWYLPILGLVGIPVSIAVANHLIRTTSEGRHFADPFAVPERSTALILGCSPTLANGRPNLYFVYRMNAAADLFDLGVVDNFIVSGDNAHSSYNEPTKMHDALVARGIPSEQIYLDYAGFRTLDSIVRASEVFGQEKITIVSQRFHNERALYLAAAHGVDAVAYDAPDVSTAAGLKTRLREQFARVKTVLDVHFLRTQPKFLGPKVLIARRDHGPSVEATFD